MYMKDPSLQAFVVGEVFLYFTAEFAGMVAREINLQAVGVCLVFKGQSSCCVYLNTFEDDTLILWPDKCCL